MIKHTSPISGIACYKDKYVATAGYDNKIILWDGVTNKALACGFHDHLANQCQFSPDGKYLLTGSSDYSARLWSVPSLRLLTVFSDHQDDVENIEFHPEKQLIATASRDHHVRVFDFSGKLLKKFQGHKKDVLSVLWSTNTQLITSSDDGTIKKWDVNSGEMIEDIDLGGVETDTIVISKKGTVFAGNDLGEIIVINKNRRQNISAHDAGIKRLCYSAQHEMLVSLSYDRCASLWKITDDGELTHISTTTLPNMVWARSCAFKGEQELAFVTFGSSYAIYNYLNDEWFTNHVGVTPGKNAVLAHDNKMYTIGDAGIVTENGQNTRQLASLCNFLITCNGIMISGGQTGEIFNVATGEVIYQHRSPLNCATVFGENYLCVGSYTGEGIILKAEKGEISFVKLIQLHENAIKGLAASDKYIYSVCATSAAAFHAVDSLELVKYLENAHDKIANGCAYLKDDIFVSVSRDLTLRLTSLITQQIIPTPHKNSIKCVAVSGDKKFIATGGYFGDVHIYNCDNQSWRSFRPTVSGISSIIYDINKKTFLASSYDGSVYELEINNE